MRLFVAADLSPEQLKELRGLVEEAKRAAPFDYIRWLPEENWHATLTFIGECDESGSAEAEIDRHLAGSPPLEGQPLRIQAFPARDKPRLLALKLEPSDVMETIHWHLNQSFGVKERHFRLHISVARFRDLDKEGADALNAAIKGLSNAPSKSWTFPSITLYESTLKQSGAVYRSLKTWPVGPQ